MNYTTILENWLKEYNSMKIQAASLKELYADKEKSIEEGQAIDYSKDKLSQSFKISSEVENTALDLALLSNRIKHLDSKLEILDKAIDKLSIKEKKIIELRYIEQKRIRYTDQWRSYKWYEISNMVGYEESWCKRIRKAAVDKMVNIMFGKERN